MIGHKVVKGKLVGLSSKGSVGSTYVHREKDAVKKAASGRNERSDEEDNMFWGGGQLARCYPTFAHYGDEENKWVGPWIGPGN